MGAYRLLDKLFSIFIILHRGRFVKSEYLENPNIFPCFYRQNEKNML